jgi:hypothetical protein
MVGEENKSPATAAELMAGRPGYLDVEVKAWGRTVRLSRLNGPAKMRAALAAELLDTDDREGMYCFGVDLLAESIVGEDGVKQFANHTEKEWLSGEIAAVGELMPQALSLNGLGAKEITAEVEAARKNSQEPAGGDSLTGLRSVLGSPSPSYATG